ncbi:MAG: glycerol kinase [Elusimicrobia bacterium]|nr:glycerol kinase [Elusimicrobiota bacterium]
MRAQEFIIALDQGSGSSRALAFDARGRVAARAQAPLRTFYPRPGWVEQDAEEIFRGQVKALDAVLSRLPRSARVSGLGFACQRSTVVLWDSRTGKPLCRALSWQDGRASNWTAGLGQHQGSVHEKTGLYLTAYYSAPKIRWLLDHSPAVRQAARRGRLRAGPVASYVLWRLTRGRTLAADPSLAQRMLLMDVRALQWDAQLLSLFGLSDGMLPKIMPSAGEWGVLARAGRKIPILAVLGDQQSAALALGGSELGAGVLNYGTGAFFLLNTGPQAFKVPGLLASVAWQKAGQPCHYFQEGTVHAAGTSLQWLQKNWKFIERLDRVDAMCRDSKRRVWALQAIGGLGAPRWDYSTWTAYAGLTSESTPKDIVRGVVEGIAFLIADIVSAAGSAGLDVRALRASGGLSRSRHLLQFQADLLQLPIRLGAEQEATAAGIAFLAAEGAGRPWARHLLADRGTREFRPKMSREEASRLLAAWRLFVETQQKLSSEMRRLGAW